MSMGLLFPLTPSSYHCRVSCYRICMRLQLNSHDRRHRLSMLVMHVTVEDVEKVMAVVQGVGSLFIAGGWTIEIVVRGSI